MINFGNISFRFRMADEVFAQQLYAGWDEFCRTCFTDILEEYLGRYDTKDSYIEIDTLELNIGAIPQELFYEEFPKRVRAELEKVLLPASVQNASSTESKGKRLDNLIHYLRYGFCLPGWDMQEFDLFEELMLFKDSEALVVLCFSEQYCFERLTRQLDGWQLNIVLTHWLAVERHDEERNLILQKWALRSPDALRMLTDIVAENRILSERIAVLIDNEGAGEWYLMLSWLTSTTLGHYEKQRHFAVALETRPLMVLRFIRETSDEGNVKRLALLLESESVRRIMVAETDSHAEVDVPEYWHHLYLWLIQHYPFNGVAMFGDKRHFVQHLHERFLFFIRKRSASTYLSKTDLTIRFLLEVFGADYYLDVLSVLYHNQPLNDDGSPVSSDYYSWEIYYMLLRLSLIKVADGSSSGISIDGADDVPSDEVYELIGSFEDWLARPTLVSNEKQILLRRLIKEQPLWVLHWIRNISRREQLQLFVELVSVEEVFALVAVVSYQEYISLSAVIRSLSDVKASVSWMQSVDIDRLEKAYISAVVAWLASRNAVRGTELIREILSRVYLAVVRGDNTSVRKVNGSDETVSAAVSEAVALLAEKQVVEISDNEIADVAMSIEGDMTVSIGRLQILLGNTAFSVAVKKRLLLQWLDAYRDNEIAFFKAIYEAGLLSSVIVLVDVSLLRHIVIRLSGATYVNISSSSFVLFVEWITQNICAVASFVSVSVEELWKRIIVQLITLRNHPNTAIDATISLIDAVGNHTATTDAFRHIIRLYEVSAADVSPDDSLTLLMLRVKEQISLRGRTGADDGDLNVVRMAFEHSLNDNKNVLAWLKSSLHSITLKQKVVKQFATSEPQAFMSLLQMSLNEDTLAAWSSVVEISTLVSVIAKVNRILADNIHLTVLAIQRYASEWKISLGGYPSVEDSLTKALLRFLLEHLARGNGLPERDVFVKTFTTYWREVITGRKEVDDTDIQVWNVIETRIVSVLKIAVADTLDNENKTDETSSISSETEARGDELSSARLKKMSRAEIVRIPEARFLMLDESDFDILAIWLSSSEVSDTVKIRLLQRYTRWQQKVFWNFIGYVYAKGAFDVMSFGAWLGIEDWLMLVAGVSYSWAETLRQAVGILAKREIVSTDILSAAFALFIARRRKDDWYRYDAIAVVKDYVSSVNDVAEKAGEVSEIDKINKTFTELLAELKVSENEVAELEDAVQPDYIPVTNAGLCLFAPWIIRLFGMLELLSEDRKDLKDMDARIRAIFILQRLVTAEQREYKESDLALNRLLVACPFNVPIPRNLELTDKEIETVASMLAGVKANWPKMENTSIGGFQRSFIEREGQLEQRENKWVLTVENKAYDILLDSLPWSYKMIRLPWLKKPISVLWRDKEEFDFDSINR
ncbi:MAG: hypothetical protein J6C92_02690 [Bacteroidaceae bacterium]|nr:hypothetical protein [Bacteroidaceae bacterium]